MDQEVLTQLQQGMISTKEAYKMLYGTVKKPKLKRAHFVKLRIRIPDEKGVNTFLRILFALPFPLFLARWGLKFVKDEEKDLGGFTKEELLKMISVRGISIDVSTTSGEKIRIKTI